MLTFTQRLEAISFNPDNIPDKFLDCVTHELIDNPVILSDGHIYDRRTAQVLISANPDDRKSPKTRQPLTQVITEAHLFRSELIQFIETQEELAQPLMLRSRVDQLEASLAEQIQANLIAVSGLSVLRTEVRDLKRSCAQLKSEAAGTNSEVKALRLELETQKNRGESPNSSDNAAPEAKASRRPAKRKKIVYGNKYQ